MADKDFIDVTIPTLKQKWLEELRKLQTDYTKKKVPFDFAGALKDIDEYEALYRYQLKSAVASGRPQPEFKTDWDWASYANPKRFEIVGEHDIQKHTKGGQLIATWFRTYLCKSTGGKISVDITDEVNSREKEKR